MESLYVWEIPTKQRKIWHELNKKETSLHDIAVEAFEQGKKSMDTLFTTSCKIMSNPPSEEILQLVQEITTTQSTSNLVHYFTDMLQTTPGIHPDIVRAFLDSINTVTKVGYRCQPIAHMMKRFIVETDVYLHDPLYRPVIGDSYLTMIQTFIDDPDQKCIGFPNSFGHRQIIGDDLQKLRDAIAKKDIDTVTNTLIDFWKNDYDFADDDMVKKAHSIFADIGEKYSEDPLFPLPRLFEEAEHTFRFIEKTCVTRFRDRQILAQFCEETKTLSPRVEHYAQKEKNKHTSPLFPRYTKDISTSIGRAMVIAQ